MWPGVQSAGSQRLRPMHLDISEDEMMRVWIKKDDDVEVKGTYEQHALIIHFNEAVEIFAPHLQAIVVTSGNDGKHMLRSLHFEDKALDFRVWLLRDKQQWAMVHWLNYFHEDEDWLVEEDHIHGEVDPK